MKAITVSTIFALAIGTLAVSANVHAEAGKRLCATWAGPTALVFKINQPKGPGGRKAADSFCGEVNNGFQSGYIDAGLPASIIKTASRISCEDLAGEMSNKKNTSDICHHIALSAVGDGAHPYKVDYDARKNNFSFERL